MTDRSVPPEPHPDDDPVDAVLDGTATPDQEAVVAADPVRAARLADLRRVADLLAEPVPPLPDDRRDAMVAIALAAFDDVAVRPDPAVPLPTDAPTDGPDEAEVAAVRASTDHALTDGPGAVDGPVGEAGTVPGPVTVDELARARARRRRSGAALGAVAAAVIVVAVAIGATTLDLGDSDGGDETAAVPTTTVDVGEAEIATDRAGEDGASDRAVAGAASEGIDAGADDATMAAGDDGPRQGDADTGTDPTVEEAVGGGEEEIPTFTTEDGAFGYLREELAAAAEGAAEVGDTPADAQQCRSVAEAAGPGDAVLFRLLRLDTSGGGGGGAADTEGYVVEGPEGMRAVLVDPADCTILATQQF